ncbi:DUF4386 domain-containing protein [Dyella subtropica]|uniref:DUF4386 domain-containing protein n=1 Tax=Dyella subtropica TaxID=2992127 RepID=UPI002256EEB4|nr:DUF4386 domain-containing protein [Dyella subtropica]
MMGHIAEASPLFKARIAGVFYLLTFLTGGFAIYVGDKLVVDGNAAATASHILANRSWVLLGFAADIAVIACYVTVTALFYGLFKPVSQSLSLLAACFSLVGCTIQAFSSFFDLAPLIVLGGAQYLSVFKVEQLQALALMFSELGGQAYKVGLVFFGLYCLLIGYLIFRSTFLPRILGVLMAFAGLGWLTFLQPLLASHLWPYIALPGFIGEGSLTLWLLVMGVNGQRWKEQAELAGA